MNRHLPRLLSDSAVYGLAGTANQVVTILLAPIYARALGVSGYGLLAVLTTTLSLASVIAGFAQQQAFFRWYVADQTAEAERKRILDVTVTLRVVGSAVAVVGFGLLAPVLAIALFGSLSELPVILLLAPIVLLDSLNLIPMSYLRAERRARLFALLTVTRAGLASVLIIALVVGFRLGVLGAVLGTLAASAATAALGIGILVLRARARPRWDGKLVRSMLAFSVPLVPAAIAGWTLNLSDRYILQAVEGRSAVGLYAAGYNIGAAINALAVAPFTLAWGVSVWEVARDDHAPHVYARVMTAFVVVSSAVAVALSALGTDVIRLLLTPEFEDARFVVPFSAFSYVVYGIYTIAATGLVIRSQTRWLPVSMGIAAATNVGLNLVLVPWIGYMGAAVGTLAGYVLLAALTGALAQRHYPVPWQYRRGVTAVAAGLALAAAALLGPDTAPWRVLCLVAYPVLLTLLGVLRAEEVRAAWSSLRRRSGQREGHVSKHSAGP